MSHDAVLHLSDGRTSVVVDVRGPGLPSVAYWGAALGPLDQEALGALLLALTPPPPHNMPDVPVPQTLVPDAGGGYMGRPGLRGHRGGGDFSPGLALTTLDTHAPGALRYTATDPVAGLTLAGELELTESGLLRLRHRVRNDGSTPYTVDALEAALPVPAHATELLDFTGRHCRERVPQRQAFRYGSWVREGRRGRTGHDATIGLLAGTPGFGFRGGQVWAVHVAWSGNHVTYAEKIPDGRPVLGGGELLLPGEVVLEAGEEYTTPWLYAAWSGEGIDGITSAFHRHLRARRTLTPRPVVLNTWEAVYFDHDLDRLLGLAETAAGIGVERFVLDDGWFRHRRDDSAGLGDWYVDDTVWPDGPGPLIERVRALGMDFGLWFEPEMINPDSDLYRAHPDWVLAPADGRLPPSWRHQQVLDLTEPDAFDHVLGRLDALLTAYDIAYVKWDHNRDLIAAGRSGRARVHAQTEAFYRLLAAVRARHPAVEIESCSSGGARIDLGVLEHTDRVWTSDCNDALERQAIQRWTGTFLPPELMGTHIGPTRAHTTSRVHDLSFRVVTALFGHFGIEWDITRAGPEEQETLRNAIAFYKRHRALLHTGTVVRADHPDPAAYLHGVVAPGAGSALYCYAQLAAGTAVVPAPVRLPGLDPRRRYRVTLVDPAGPARTGERGPAAWTKHDALTLPGSVLLEAGLQLPVLHPEQALLLHVLSCAD
ncbi:alpha-galactosidase [Streptomyces sp. NPDC015127]|uniref:alpha-galactosidase n=1 Tax=Streptomyces sp. NPDC015127 TaxID=3364939 RepID=UPI003703698A